MRVAVAYASKDSAFSAATFETAEPSFWAQMAMLSCQKRPLNKATLGMVQGTSDNFESLRQRPMHLAGKIEFSQRATVFLVLAIIHLAFSFGINPPGYLTYDSGTYHYMVKTLATTGSYIVSNGYNEFPSKAFEVAQLRIHNDSLVSQYPEFLTVLSYPFYLAFGYQGLILLNSLAFLGINALILGLTQLLFGKARLGWLAVVIYSFGTFAWEYSQSSYPHLSSTLFVLGSYFLLALALSPNSEHARAPSKRLLLIAGAGLVAGFAVGLRLDAAFAIPGLFVILILVNTPSKKELVALGAGLSPGLLFLSLVNFIKFGTVSPLSYGAVGKGYIGGLNWYVPISIAAAVVFGFFVMLRSLPADKRPRAWFALALGFTALCLFRFGDLWSFLVKLTSGTYQIVVDLRIRDLAIKEPALSRTADGAMVYMGGVKKSLLQSCPYMIILPFAMAASLLHRRHLRQLFFLSLVPGSFIAYYSYLAWHGSVALNMRYLNPTLPFLAILTALAWDRISRGISESFAVLYGSLLLVSLTFLFSNKAFSLFQQEFLFLSTPLALALCVCLFEAMRRLGRIPSLSQPVVSYLLVTAFAWSGAVAFGRDYPTSARLRQANLTLADGIRPYIEDDSLIFSDMSDSCWKLIDEVSSLRIADPQEDGYTTFRALTRFHLDHNRDVYMAYSPYTFSRLLDSGLLTGFDLELLTRVRATVRPELLLFRVTAQ